MNMHFISIFHIEHRLYLAVLLLILQKPHHTYAEGAPRKLALADDQRIIFTHINETLELKCPIDTSDTKTFVEWSRGNESLYMEPGYEINKKGVLRIKSVTMKHAGTYTCEAVNGYGFVQVQLNVIVDKPEVGNVHDIPINPNSVNRVHVSQPSIKRRPTEFIDDVGGQATFHCVSTGQPTPHIFWFKNGFQIKSAETEISKGKVHSTLKLRGLKMSDAGIYKCIARNIVGEDHLDFHLQVTEVPKPPRILSLEPTSSTIKEGEAAVFWCEVDSKPGLKLHIKWLKKLSKEEITESVILDDMTLFRSGANFYRPLSLPNATNTNSGDGLYKSKLLIKNSCKEDSGTYVCLALNDKGFSFKNVSLTVVNTALKSYPGHSGPFTTSDTSLVVIVIIALVIVLLTIVLAIQLYFRSSSQKTVASKRVFFDPECGTLSQDLKKTVKKTTISYPELNDPQSKSNLLCSNSTYGFETENQVSKTFHVKTYIH
ncbi:fibroblast growth factor receptor-like 1 [Argiope bruennichi]|uniref:fibroblast growth factor receptor-like 1 n=1 Tax=Argiope bruennichi TaxID=94029 RepID=UPI00249539F7|nr:fibroblast growth factor receptor-like 1 [Argiope bruennichi]XP_055928465.1 fibroblast growth factor receptor-like 1 [Argiope bruennichi]